MEFIKQEWTLFRSMDTLTQKSGVSKQDIPKLVAKELVDNALDISDNVHIECDGNTFQVWNDGDGIPEDKIAELFSINRPLVSSKLIKLPTRGALGNGLRVVVGAVIATGGKLFVSTNGYKYEIEPQPDGTSIATSVGKFQRSGTMVEISLGQYQIDDSWARDAAFYNRGEKYKGKTSGYWYNSEIFYEIAQAYDGTVYDLVTVFDGCTGTKAGKVAKLFEKNRKTKDLTFDESQHLLAGIRNYSKPVKSTRLGTIGEIVDTSYGIAQGEFELPSSKGGHDASVPYSVEVFIKESTYSGIELLINKSPAIKSPHLFHEKNKKNIYGLGIDLYAACSDELDLTINVNSPVVPITSDGKEPDLSKMKETIDEALQKAVRKYKSQMKKEMSFEGKASVTQKKIVLDHLEEAVAKASGNGVIRFSQRQLYYVVRPFVMDEIQEELTYKYFSDILTAYERKNGDIKGIYRDSRGSLYTPHTGETIPMGTFSVEQYRRPEYMFNKILYIEKEGIFEILNDVKFPERYDCALITSKGYASRAIKDLLDLLGETDEELEVYCIHDCDKAGTMIYQTLVEETKSRGARKIKVIDLGLNPDEVLAMGLEVETVKKTDGKSGDSLDQESKKWLQTHRVELNAMTSLQLVDWLERKFQEYAGGKIVPEEDVLRSTLHSNLHRFAETKIRDEILAANQYESKVNDYVQELAGKINTDALEMMVQNHLIEKPADRWSVPLKAMAEEIVLSH